MLVEERGEIDVRYVGTPMSPTLRRSGAESGRMRLAALGQFGSSLVAMVPMIGTPTRAETGPQGVEVVVLVDVVVVVDVLVVVVVGCVGALVQPRPTRCSGWGWTPAPARTPALRYEQRHDDGSATATKKSRVQPTS